jgi:hypothetical protein
MALREQWVNYPTADGNIGAFNVVRSNLTDGDIATVDQMGRIVYVEVAFQRAESGMRARLIMDRGGNNATYTAHERHGHAGIFVPRALSGARIAADGKARFRVRVGVAGGDEFTFKARSAAGTEVAAADSIATRRKLFYQIMPMVGARSISSLPQFESVFWNTADRLYLKLEQYAAGRPPIPGLENYNDTDPAVEAQVKHDARHSYDTSKAPFSFAVLIVRKNCIPGVERKAVPETVAGTPIVVDLQSPLFHFADSTAAWYRSARWQPTRGTPQGIPQSDIRVLSPWQVEIDTTGLPAGRGTLHYTFNVVAIMGMGLSYPTENLVTVASEEFDGTPVAEATMRGILVHEVGHKIGMVPGPQGDRDLARQSTHYTGHGHQGPHCHHPAPLVRNYMRLRRPLSPPPACTMFGDTSANTDAFCEHCRPSVRKLDVNPERKVGIRHQF